MSPEALMKGPRGYYWITVEKVDSDKKLDLVKDACRRLGDPGEDFLKFPSHPDSAYIAFKEEKGAMKSLKSLKKKFLDGSFKLTDHYEDCHSAIEFYLTQELGDLGKKVHTGRSRNDQVIVAMRLFAKDNLVEFKNINKIIAKTFLDLAIKHENIPMPGYTHLQRAMPSSWGLWFSSYAESFIDNVDLIDSTINWIDSNPLGSAAGYGVAIPLNRDLVTQKLGFHRTQVNSLYVQNSRGKYEMQILNTLKQSMLDIRKLSWDMSLFLSQEFNLLKINEKYSTGSSIMPNKN